MLVKKLIMGQIEQVLDTDTGLFVQQKFIPNDPVHIEYSDLDNNIFCGTEEEKIKNKVSSLFLPVILVQPEDLFY